MSFLSVVKKQDWILNSAILFLGAAGLISLWSSTRLSGGVLFYQQLVWYLIGLTVMFFAAWIDWRPFINYSKLINGIYIFSLFLLTLTIFIAPKIRGVRSWLPLGPFQFQTSEFAKLALIIVFSYFWAKAHVGIAHLKNLGISLFYFLLPAVLVALQPDMGSVLVLFMIWFGYLLVSGIRWSHLLAAFFIFLIGGIFLWTSFLADYQKERIVGIIYPERDPLGINYSVIQSKIAIGSAGFLGKGFGQGTQLQLGFLPEPQNDFIFSAFIEEWGMLGGFLVVAAFLTVTGRIIFIGLRSENNFAKLVCLGAVIMLMTHFILNSGFNLGLLPVIGIPFPFMSYGGSNLLINLTVIGIIQSILLRNKF